MSTDKNNSYLYWNSISSELPEGENYDVLLAEHYGRAHLRLIQKWLGSKASGLILKTDLFAEGISPSRAFLWDILKNGNSVVGIDISIDIVSRTISNTRRILPGTLLHGIACDLRQLPFSSNSFDAIISDSSLDHFHNKSDITTSINELSRVIKPKGIIIITMDNKHNFTEPLFRLWIWLKLSPFFIGKTISLRKLKKSLCSAGLQVTDTAAIIHNPRFFTKLIIKLLRRTGGSKNDKIISALLALFDKLENTRTKYLTAQFIAVRAVKL